jgi:hypothetical protein
MYPIQPSHVEGQWLRFENDAMQTVLLGIQNRTCSLYLAAMHRILIPTRKGAMASFQERGEQQNNEGGVHVGRWRLLGAGWSIYLSIYQCWTLENQLVGGH